MNDWSNCNGCECSNDGPIAACNGFWTVNAVEVRADLIDKARKYYDIAWLPARRVALQRGYVADFYLLLSDSEKPGPSIQWVTLYADKAMYELREKHFAEVFLELKTPNPIVVDGLGRPEIFGSVTGLEDYRLLASSSSSCVP